MEKNKRFQLRHRRHNTRAARTGNLHTEWIRAEQLYREAGRPFGPSMRALEMWIEFGRQARLN